MFKVRKPIGVHETEPVLFELNEIERVWKELPLTIANVKRWGEWLDSQTSIFDELTYPFSSLRDRVIRYEDKKV